MRSNNTLSIVYYNIRKERIKTIAPLLKSQEIQEIDILAIQKLWVNLRNSSTYNPASSRFHLAHRNKEETRTCWYVNKDLDIESWEADFTSGDCYSLSIKLKKGGESEEPVDLWIHNVYNPSPRSTRSRDGPSIVWPFRVESGRVGRVRRRVGLKSWARNPKAWRVGLPDPTTSLPVDNSGNRISPPETEGAHSSRRLQPPPPSMEQ